MGLGYEICLWIWIWMKKQMQKWLWVRHYSLQIRRTTGLLDRQSLLAPGMTRAIKKPVPRHVPFMKHTWVSSWLMCWKGLLPNGDDNARKISDAVLMAHTGNHFVKEGEKSEVQCLGLYDMSPLKEHFHVKVLNNILLWIWHICQIDGGTASSSLLGNLPFISIPWPACEHITWRR